VTDRTFCANLLLSFFSNMEEYQGLLCFHKSGLGIFVHDIFDTSNGPRHFAHYRQHAKYREL